MRSSRFLGCLVVLPGLIACGGDLGDDEGTISDISSPLAQGGFGDSSVAAARAGNGYIVEVEPGAESTVDAWVASHGASSRRFRFVHARAVDVRSPGDVASLRSLPGVVGVYPNRIVSAIARPGGGGGGSTTQVLPAGVARVRAKQAWAVSTGAGVGIAVVDTGIDPLHADLTHPTACFTAYASCGDDHGHGTHVAGISAALNNTIGVVGVAPGAVPYAVRVLDAAGSGTDETIIAGLEWILDNANSVSPPIRVANLSLGRPGSAGDNPVMHQAVQNLVAAGITVVVAAGNDQGTEISQQVPAAYPEVLSVASTTALSGKGPSKGACAGAVVRADTASYFTTDGAGVTVSAPGAESESISNGCMLSSTGILSLAPGGGTARMSGTSMASPTVAGVVALLISNDAALQPGDVAARVAANASCTGSAPLNSPTSAYTFDGVREGVADAVAALAGSGSSCP